MPDNYSRLAAYFRDERIFPEGNKQSRQIVLALYRMLVAGKPVNIGHLSSHLKIDQSRVTKVLESLAPSHLVYDAGGDITAYRGLSLLPGPHELKINGNQLYAWCALDCLFLPELLNRIIIVRSVCRQTGQKIKLTLSPQKLVSVLPKTVHVSFITPDHVCIAENLRQNFCCHVNFFYTEHAGKAWLKRNDQAMLVGLETAYSLARIRNCTSFGDNLNENSEYPER